mmetsp:Transcript_9000/g.13919  ORF Transcript_9000/g.13919 Transcript_9000/m.13919 type:complete len:102 (+) Transcript_9000:222-527(+)
MWICCLVNRCFLPNQGQLVVTFLNEAREARKKNKKGPSFCLLLTMKGTLIGLINCVALLSSLYQISIQSPGNSCSDSAYTPWSPHTNLVYILYLLVRYRAK